MDNVPEKVKELFKTADKQDRFFLRGVPTLKEITKEILNFEKFLEEGSLKGKRIRLGGVYELDGQIVGYNSFTVFQDAKATPYERKFMDMGSGLDYVLSKKLFVHPEQRSKGIGKKIIKENLNLAKKLDKHYLCDLEKNNYKMFNILLKQGFEEDFNWTTKTGLKMMRLFHE